MSGGPAGGGALRPDDPAPTSVSRGMEPLPHGIRRIGVIGAGVMGSGIAQWIAARGCDVLLRDVQPACLDRAGEVMRGLFDGAVERGKLSAADAASGWRRIATTTGWEGFDTCDLVIEAIVEDVAAKRKLFTEVVARVGEDTLLASNTSALPIEEIAGHVPNPARTLGLHFFNPVSRMPLVELVVGPATSAATAARALGFVRALGKSPITCRSSPGFLVTRVLFFYLNEAVRRWEQGVPVLEIDRALRDFGWPMGPLRLIDEVGVDVTVLIFRELAHYFPGRFAPTTTCGWMLAAGLKGRKNGAGRGFYRYEDEGEMINEQELVSLFSGRSTGGPVPARRDIAGELMRIMVDEAQRCLTAGVVQSPGDVDFALRSGAGFPASRGGLMEWARVAGIV